MGAAELAAAAPAATELAAAGASGDIGRSGNSGEGGDSGQAGGRRNKLLLGVGTVAVLALVAWGVSTLLGQKGAPKGKAPKLTLMTPPAPPPPPPPPKFEKKPEPPKPQKEVALAQPVQQQKAEPAQAPELKMDGPAGDGPSGFAGGAISSEDISKLGQGKAAVVEKPGLFNPYTQYATMMKGELKRLLAKHPGLRRRQYQVEIQVWVGADGSIERVELAGSSGDADTDTAIRSTLAGFPSFPQPLPPNMPQPVRLRITTRA